MKKEIWWYTRLVWFLALLLLDSGEKDSAQFGKQFSALP